MDESNSAILAETYESLTHVGWEWGISNRTLGQELERAGYRYFGSPTQKALNEGLAIRRKGSGYRWSRERVGSFIEQRIGGYKLSVRPKFLVTPIVIE